VLHELTPRARETRRVLDGPRDSENAKVRDRADDETARMKRAGVRETREGLALHERVRIKINTSTFTLAYVAAGTRGKAGG
jgi:hypothetical protein